MTGRDSPSPRATRRGFLSATAGLAAVAGANLAPGGARAFEPPPAAEAAKTSEPFWGEHQGGVVTPAQAHTYIAAFDLVTTKRADVEK
jgi:deferrochelatase/peroxidase EfeB